MSDTRERKALRNGQFLYVLADSFETALEMAWECVEGVDFVQNNRLVAYSTQGLSEQTYRLGMNGCDVYVVRVWHDEVASEAVKRDRNRLREEEEQRRKMKADQETRERLRSGRSAFGGEGTTSIFGLLSEGAQTVTVKEEAPAAMMKITGIVRHGDGTATVTGVVSEDDIKRHGF